MSEGESIFKKGVYPLANKEEKEKARNVRVRNFVRDFVKKHTKYKDFLISKEFEKELREAFNSKNTAK
ncbi:MAG: hypothetical protein J6T10_11155 [Methanobrevibacter sp.]|nr:hypothetical protein [Methanobrevibacter sp.]